VFLSDGSSKTLHKKYPKIVSKSFNKKIGKKSQTDLFLICLSRFWAFFGEGGLKTPPKKHPKNGFDPGPFLAPDPLTNHGVGAPGFFCGFWRPLGPLHIP
jgi:hypothetical protein